MSDEAERFVETLALKGSALELLRTIAKHIPKGQTTTPPMTTDELATPAKQSEKTVRRNRDVFIRDEVIRVHDGGRGNVARYEILNLAGERPLTTAPLPLLGRPKPRRTKEQRSTLVTMTNLFDETLVKVTNDRDNWRARIVNVGQIVRRCIQTLVIVTNDRAYALGHFVRRCAPPWRRLVRARDVHTFKEHTHTAPRDGPPEREDPVPRPRRHPWHAWCGRVVCVPQELHDDWRRKGHEAAWLFAFYERRCVAIAPDEKILVNDFTFWRTAMKAELATPPARAPGPRRRPAVVATSPPSPPCPHQPRCLDPAACVDRTMAEWVAQKEQSG